MVRLHFNGSGLDEFVDNGFADAYLNCQFLPPDASYIVPFDPAWARALARGQQPTARRYTVRSWDPTTRSLAIDFVLHGGQGVGGRWAGTARVGDRLQMVGPGGAWNPAPDVAWHLLVGDASALPAITRAAERATHPVLVVLGGDREDLGPLDAPLAGSHVTWVRGPARHDHGLAGAVARLRLPAGNGQAFVHGEAEAVRAVRDVLLSRSLVAPEDLSFSPYWHRGLSDEQWRGIKSSWLKAVQREQL